MKINIFDLKSYEVTILLDLYRETVLNLTLIHKYQKRLSYYQHLYVIWRIVDLYGENLNRDILGSLFQISPCEIVKLYDGEKEALDEFDFFYNCDYLLLDPSTIESTLTNKLIYLPDSKKIQFLYSEKEVILIDIHNWILDISTKIEGFPDDLYPFKSKFKYPTINSSDNLSTDKILMLLLVSLSGVFEKNLKTAFAILISHNFEFVIRHLKYFKNESSLIMSPDFFQVTPLLWDPKTWKNRMIYDYKVDGHKYPYLLESLYVSIKLLNLELKSETIYPAEVVRESILAIPDDPFSSTDNNLYADFDLENIESYRLSEYEYFIYSEFEEIQIKYEQESKVIKLEITKSNLQKIFQLFVNLFNSQITPVNENIKADIALFFGDLFFNDSPEFRREYIKSVRPLELKTKNGLNFLLSFIRLLILNNIIKDLSYAALSENLIHHLKRDGQNERIGLSDRLRKRTIPKIFSLNRNELSKSIGLNNNQEFLCPLI